MLHPCSQGFLFEHSLDLTSVATWRVAGALDRHELTVLGSEPPRAEVQFAIDGEAITGIITADATISEIKRQTVSAH